jgi:hypothetical protein
MNTTLSEAEMELEQRDPPRPGLLRLPPFAVRCRGLIGGFFADHAVGHR